MERFLESGMEVVMEFMRILMYAAPLCLGCYFADLVGNLGGQIVSSFVNCVLLYLVVTGILYFGVNSIYVALAGGKDGLSTFWRNMTEPSLLAVATCSSAATIPASIKSGGETYKITSVGSKAFYKDKNVRNIKGGNNLEKIGNLAFSNCQNLVTVSLLTAASLKEIQTKAFYKCKSCKILKSRKLQIILIEGKTREIRNVLESQNIGTKTLVRVRIGNVKLDDLPPGESRELTEKEVQGLLNLCKSKSQEE
jgi:hypothetical protein